MPVCWLPLRPESFYAEAGINLRINSNVASIDSKARNVVIAGGDTVAYDRLLLATGAEPVATAESWAPAYAALQIAGRSLA
jgi:NAD(P)H-nitrite reductase large subunit